MPRVSPRPPAKKSVKKVSTGKKNGAKREVLDFTIDTLRDALTRLKQLEDEVASYPKSLGEWVARIPPSHPYAAFGTQCGLLADRLRNRRPDGVVAVVVTPQDQVEAPPAFIRSLPTVFMDRRVVFVPTPGQVPEGCEGVLVARPSDTPLVYASAIAKTRGPVVVNALGDPLFDDFQIVGEVVGLRVSRLPNLQTLTTYALQKRGLVFDAPKAQEPTPLPVATTAETQRVEEAKRRPVLAFVVDRRGWCFDRAAQEVAIRLADDYDLRVLTVPEALAATWGCDVLVARRERFEEVRAALRPTAAVLALFENPALVDGTIPAADVVCVANDGFAEALRADQRASAGLVNLGRFPPVIVVEAGVDLDLFRPSPPPAQFAVGWCGNSAFAGGAHKGLDLVREACRMASVPLVVSDVADASRGDGRPHGEMPGWYRNVSVVVCMSVSEGAPNPLLEAMASGRPVVSTAVGLAPKIVVDGVTGFVVERSVEALADALWRIQRRDLAAMGRAARQAVEPYGWDVAAKRWRGAVVAAAEGARQRVAAALRDPIDLRVDRPARAKPKILLLCDVPGWAFDVNLRAMAEALRDKADFDFWYVNPSGDPGGQHQELPPLWAYDRVYVSHHRWRQLHALDWSKALGCLRSRWFWQEQPRPAGDPERALVNRFRAFHAVTREVYDELEGRCPNLAYLTNPVDTGRFSDATPVVGEVVPTWNGNARHGLGAEQPGPLTVEEDVKGFATVVEPAVRALLEEGLFNRMPIAEYSTGRKKPEDMPAFYRLANLSICASAYEGAPNSIMEAMAMGHAVVATRVGNLPEIAESAEQHLGESGILFLHDRTPATLASALRGLAKDPKRVEAMGRANREEVRARWSWSAWADRYWDFLQR